jgi:hypothetical protein
MNQRILLGQQGAPPQADKIIEATIIRAAKTYSFFFMVIFLLVV